jgi:hypothetical protein
VQAGTQLMAVVPLHAVYVVANYKETQLTNVAAGQPVEIEVDAFPGHVVKGHVDSLSPASGLEFALLPPDNATGNFTKIVQRIPVKIAIEPSDALAGRLRAGMSVEPVIDTRTFAEAPTAASETSLSADRSRRARHVRRRTLPRPFPPPPAADAAPAIAAPANQNADAVSFTTWLAVIGATLGAFLAVSTSRSSTPRWPTSRARSAPASTTAAGSPPPI